MIALSNASKLTHALCGKLSVVGLGLLVFAVLVSPAFAQTETSAALSESNISARKIFIMLFLMLGPIKILVPFVNLTRDADPVLRRRLATRAILYSLAALAMAGLLAIGRCFVMVGSDAPTAAPPSLNDYAAQ